MRVEAVIDTSWLLELYKVPGHYSESRSAEALAETDAVIEKGCMLWVTAPVIFELANHIVHVKEGGIRRRLSKRLHKDLKDSDAMEVPWTIHTVDKGIVLRSADIVSLADRFQQMSGPKYSFADLSIIDLVENLRRRERGVKVFAFDKQLQAYSD